MVATDKPVPSFTLPATGTKSLSLTDFKDRNLVVYFYPKDNTPGCTRESQDFRDQYSSFQSLDCDIVGVSRDSVASHEKFRDKLKLPFDLQADCEQTLCDLFDVIHEKNLYGRKYMGLVRSTFLIDKKGVLRAQWRKVRVPGHVEKVFEALSCIQGNSD